MLLTQYKKILVIKHGSLGDIVFSFEAMHAIRKHYKNSDITLLTESKFIELLKKTKYFDQFIEDNRRGFIKTFDIIIKILFLNYDLIIDLQNSNRTSFYNFFWNFLGKSKISGSGIFANFRYHFPPQGVESPSEGLMNQLKIINIDKYKIDYDWLNVNSNNINSENLILIIPGVSKSGSKKQWPPKKFAKLSSILEEKGFNICVVGQKSDTTSIKQIILNCKNAIDLTDLSPPEIIYSIARKSVLIISNDTGPGHIAALSKKNILWLGLDNQVSRSNLMKNLNSFYLLSNPIDKISVSTVLKYIETNKLVDKLN